MNEEPGSQDLEDALALIRIGHQLDGQEPSDEAMDRARRALAGETSLEDARAELRRSGAAPRGDPSGQFVACLGS